MKLTIDSVAPITALNSNAQDYLTSGSTDKVGRVMHEALLNKLRRGSQPEGQMFGVTDKSVMTYSVNARTHEERASRARNAGRAFAANASNENEALLFIGCTSVGVGHDTDSEYALTFVQDLSELRAAESWESFANAILTSEICVFLDELRDNTVVATINDGDLCLPPDEYAKLSEADRVGKTTSQNRLLCEVFVGSMISFPFVQAGGLELANS